jgi:hypothetical protein
VQNPFCEAERVGDEMVCPLCEISWPVGAEDPPVCPGDDLIAEMEAGL